MSSMTKPQPAKDAAFVYLPNGGAPISKIDQFKWTVVDRPGEFLMIDKNDLDVDTSYQRDQSKDKIRVLAREWSWKACGSISVADRRGGFLVFDGYHRVLAARMRSDISELPCLVFQTETVDDEADGFLRANTFRKPVTSMEKFKALVMTGDKEALLVKGLADAHEYRIAPGHHGRTLRCISLVMRHAEDHPELLTAMWPLIVEIQNGESISERIVDSLIYIESRLAGTDASLLRKPWRNRLLSIGREGLIDATNRASAYYARGGARVWAGGVVQAINKGLRNKLVIPDMGEE